MPVVVACLVPAAPVLLTRLTGDDVPEVAAVREAVAEAVGLLHGVDRVVVVATRRPGSLAGFGGPGPHPSLAPDAQAGGGWELELATWLLEESGVADLGGGGSAGKEWTDLTPAGSCDVENASTWLGGLHAAEARTGLLLLADGSNTRGARAPGGDDPRGELVDVELRDALVRRRAVQPADAAAVGATAGAATAVMAGLPGGEVTVLYDRAPLGVCYLVATWTSATAGGPR